ncbi:MAG TPA: glycosyltransferase family 4 protein, partial [Pararobbsia sp.]|nr:glycosyltransferase family 4 protein [Pararobbsia sp.]
FRSMRDTYQTLFTVINAGLEGWAFRRSRVIVPVSHKVAEEVALHAIDPAAMQVIHNGVDIDEFRPGPSERASFGLPGADPADAADADAADADAADADAANGDAGEPRLTAKPFVLLFAGDIRISRKNLDSVLLALEQLPEHVHLAVAANVPERNPFAQRVAKAGLASRVHFLGSVKRMPALMRSVDAFVFPSRYEAMSLVMLEALSSGLPVITARTAGGAEVIDAASGIILDDPNDVNGLAAAITTLIADPARVRAMGRAARECALTLGWRSMGERYLALYRRIAASPAYETLPGSADAAQRNTGIS